MVGRSKIRFDRVVGPMALAADSTADQHSSIEGNAAPARRAQVHLLALAAAFLAILPVSTARHLPLLDAPGHESRLAVLRDLLLTGQGSDFYDLGSFFLPNIAFDVIGLGLAAVFGPESVGRIFFALTLILTLWGVLALNRVATGRRSAVPLVAALLLYNLVSILGFFSYAFGLALVPWALAGRLLLERASGPRRFAAGAIFGVALLFCHVFDFGIYAVMSVGFAFAGLVSGRIGFGRAALWAAEQLPALLLFFAMSTSGAGHARFESHFLAAKLFGIVKSVTSGSMVGDAAFVAGAGFFVLLAAFWSRTRLVPAFLPGLIGLVVLYLVLPDKLASGSYVDKRMPIAIALMLSAGLDIRIRRSAASAVLIGLIALTLIVKQGALAVLWRSFDPLIDRLVDTLERLPAGSVVMQAECEPEASDVRSIYRERQPSMTHLAAMAGFDDSRFIAGTWAIAGQHTVGVGAAYRPFYDLQDSFGSSTCAEALYRTELQRIENLAWAQKAAGGRSGPIYFLLIRPPKQESLSSGARLVSADPHFELYEVEAP